MTFHHNPLPLRANAIQRIDSPNGRKYLCPNGESYESVTTWLGRQGDNSWVDKWREAVGVEEADKVTRRAAKRGTLLHENVEAYLKNEHVEVSKLSMFDKMLFVPFTKVLDKHVNNIRALEYPLFSVLMRLAGTVDCVAEFDGVPAIIDFKTAKRKKDREDIENYFLQTTIYSLMIQEMYGVRIDKMVIIMALDYENKVQIFEESRKNWTPILAKQLQLTSPR